MRLGGTTKALCGALLVYAITGAGGFVVSPCFALESVCATVKIEINQELTLERQAFDARMQIANGLPNDAVDNVRVVVRVTDAAGNPVAITADPDNTTATFFVREDSMTGIGAVDGTGTVAASTTADIHWLLIPARGASNGNLNGTAYDVGATLSYSISGTPFSHDVAPDRILVKPMPALALDYFLAQDVYADDAFTPEIEPAIPFTFGLRVKNNGPGDAKSVRISSAQPRIVENEQGLLIGFLIEGTEVNGQPAAETLLANLGNIAANTSGIARWIMTTSLSGEFTQFSAAYTHADALGGQVTSLIEGVATHTLLQDVLVDLPGRDGIRDFLADDLGVLSVYESQSLQSLVSDLSTGASLNLTGTSGTMATYSFAMASGGSLSYAKLSDPLGGLKVVKSVTRSDGKIMVKDNVWLSKRRNEVTKEWEHFFHLFDSDTTGSYTVVFDDPPVGPRPPVLQFIPDQSGAEGSQISFIAVASDPDGTTPVLQAFPLPAGASFTDQGGGSGLFDWYPAVGQAGTYDVTFAATDGALTDTQRARITVHPAWDTDGDGMADAWELRHFGNLLLDGTGDADGDGISDLAEYLAGTDPTTGLAPSVPIVLAPADGAEVALLQPLLEVKTSVDRDGGTLSFGYEVYADAGMTQLAAAAAVAPGAGTTSWEVSAALADNAWYWWRVRATDGEHLSAWAYGRFFVNTANDAPAGVVLSAPRDGAGVDTLTPVLEVANAGDLDGDALTYSFEVFGDAALTVPVASAAGIAAGANGTTSWTLDTALTDGLEYWWRATATDAHGAATTTAAGSFTVNTANHAPTVAAIDAPVAGSEVTDVAVTLTAGNATDADSDPLTYLFETDTTASFNSANLLQSVAVAEGPVTTSWDVSAALADNTTYYWRVRATDGSADSPWTTGSFFVNTANDAPATPTVRNPSDGGEVWTVSPELTLNPATDLDGDALTYDYEVYSDAALTTLVASAAGQALVWAVPVSLTADSTFFWRARAADVHGAASAWTAATAFFINLEGYNDPPTIALSRPAAAEPVTTATVFEIAWADGDPDSNASITLYYDTDDTGFDGLPITSGIEESDPANTYQWDTSSFPDGTYFVYAVIADEENTAQAYAPGPLVIDRTGPDVTAEPPGGLYGAAQSVTLSANEAATIYYTTDGSDPTTASTVYGGPIAVDTDTTIRIFAVDGLGNTGAVTDESYTIDTVPPAVAIDAFPAIWRATALTVTGTMEADATVSLAVDTAATTGAVSYPTASTWSADVTGLVEGTNNFTATATDAAGNSAQAVAALEVNLNLPPVLDPIGAKSVSENQTLSFTVTASDPDGTTPVVTASGLPAGATFDGAVFAWTPTYEQAGNYTVDFTASDGSLTDGESVSIGVLDVNRPPTAPVVRAPRDQQRVGTVQPLLEVMNGVDPDGDLVTYSFQVFSDAALTQPAASTSGVAAGAGGVTAWTVSPALTDGARYYWRAVAADEHGASAATASASFVVTQSPSWIPAVTSIYPPDGGTAPPNTDVSVTFSEPMDPLTITTGSFTLSQYAPFQDIAGGYGHTVALRSDGTVVAWGYNEYGQTTLPPGLSGVTAVAAGNVHSVALKDDGTVVAWGKADEGQLAVPPGLAGVTAIAAGAHTVALRDDGTVISWGGFDHGQNTTPPGLSGVVAIAAGLYHTVALKDDGTVAAWGYDAAGQTDVPAGLFGVVAIAAGDSHTVALKDDGTVVAWGDSSSGACDVPPGLSGAIAISAGITHTVALKNDGTVAAWGYSAFGQTDVPPGLAEVVAVAAGGYCNMALKNDGTMTGWGDNRYGQHTVPTGLSGIVAVASGYGDIVALKSDGTVVGRGPFHEAPAGLSEVAALAAGGYHTVVLKTDGTAVAWGNDYYGEGSVPPGLSGVTSVAAGSFHNLALKTDGTVVAWGYDNHGQSTVPAGLSGVAAVSAGLFHSVALTSDGTVVAWGQNTFNQCTVPAGLSGVVAIAGGWSHTVALKNDGSVEAWGRNDAGQCAVPPGLSGVVAVAAGNSHTVALLSDGSVIGWGSNAYGQCTAPAGLSGIIGIAAGWNYTMAIKNDGTVVAWGRHPAFFSPLGPYESAVAGSVAYDEATWSGTFTPSAPLEYGATYLAAVNTGGRSELGVPLAADVLWSFTVTDPLAIQTFALPDATEAAPYSRTLVVAGGSAPYAWSLVSGSLPAGLSLDAQSGVISGTPSAAGAGSFTVEVVDAFNATDVQALTLVVYPSLGITTSGLPGGYAGAAYTQTLNASGGKAPLSWSIAAGSLPAGLSLSAGGVISGTPTTIGTSAFSVQVADANNATVTRAFGIEINGYTVTPSAGADGSLSPATAQTVSHNQTTSFTVIPDTGHHIESVSGCAGVLAGSVYTTGPITADCTVAATFAINSYTVTPSAGASGNLTPPTAQAVDYNQTTSFTVTPDTGYHVGSVSGCGGTLVGSTYTTGPITADCTVAATFAIDSFTVTPSAGANGNLTPPTAQAVDYNQTISFTVTPDTGYHVASVSGCAGVLVGSVYTTGPITADCTVAATFAIDNPPVNVALNMPASASSSRSGSSNVPANAVDGSASTYWRSSSSGTQWLLVDLGSDHNVSNVRVSWNSSYYARSFQIQTSTDGSTFTTRYSTTSGTGATADVTLATVGARYVRVYCTVANSSNYRITELEVYGVPVFNQPPVADAGPDRSGIVGRELTFSGAASSDSDGSIASYSWNWGDGSANGSGVTATHAYTGVGTWTVTLTVIDNAGATGSDTAIVTMAPNQAPAADAGADKTGDAGAAISFTGSGTDADGTIVGYSWNWGDSTADTNTQNASHTYAAAGTYTATLTVTDDLGATGSDTAVVTVTVPPPNQAPAADAGADKTGDAGAAISFTGSGTDADGTIVGYSWNWGDSTADTNTQNASHTYAAAGTYTATLTVTDNLGATGSDTALVTVAAGPPVNLALNQPASASSSRSGSSNVPANAVDGSASTSWRSSSSGIQWLMVDLGSSQSISNVKVFWNSSYYARSFQVQTSTDGSTFTMRYSTTSGTGATADVTFATVGARYVRVYSTVANSSNYRITELEVYP